MYKVFIDAGHGGTDPGAVANGLNEKDITLNVSNKVVDLLKGQNIDVKTSRVTDVSVSLPGRVNLSNNYKPNCFVSIHCNSAENTSAYGVETFCYKLSSSELADKIHNEIIKAKLYNKDRKVKEGNFYVVRETTSKACLVELAFISNSNDVKLLRTKQDEYALAIAKGICEYLGFTYKDLNNSAGEKYSYKNGSYGTYGVTTANLNVRDGRGTGHKIIGTIPKGTKIKVNYCLDNWFSTWDLDTEGYVCGEYVRL